MNARRRRPPAFTLTELLVVLGIIALLVGLAVPAFGPLLRSANVTKLGGLVVDQFSFARQTALSRNRAVEVRFYRYAGSAAEAVAFRAVRSVLIEEDGSEHPLGNLIRFPPATILSDAADKSTLLAVAANASAQSVPRAGQENVPALGGGTPTGYVAFQFGRDGGTNLDANGPPGGQRSWHVTARSENAPVLGNGLPADYITVQLDPLTGRPRVFRP